MFVNHAAGVARIRTHAERHTMQVGEIGVEKYVHKKTAFNVNTGVRGGQSTVHVPGKNYCCH